MRKVALITDGWKRLFTYAWPAGIMQRIRATNEDVNLYIFNSTGNWSSDRGYNLAEYNIFNLPDFSDFDGIIIELNNVSLIEVVKDVARRAKEAGVPVVSIANKVDDFYYVGIDNYAAMWNLMEHLHGWHRFQSFWLLMGPEDNYESIRREKGLRDYAENHGISISEDQIWHGNFDYAGGYAGFQEMWHRHGRLPDAVICVNDNVAVAVCEAAAEKGFSAPKDFSVTGFDNFDKASFYIPTITTVGHVREEAASAGMDVLLRIWSGQQVPENTYTRTELICQESCGCRQGSSQDPRRKMRDRIMDDVDSESFDKEVLTMEAEMMQCNTVEEMMECIPQCIPSMKCDAMYLVLDDHINDYKDEGEENIYLDTTPLNEAFLLKGYPEKMHMTFSYDEDGTVNLQKREMNGIFPEFESEKSGQTFLFLPLHFGERTVGYVVLRNAIYLMEKHYLFQIIHALTRSMENLHKKEMLTYMNKRLASLYIMDQLTGMYNRMGYDSLGKNAFLVAKKDGKRLIVLFADLDRLKYINDTHGHKFGDIAISTAAKAILKCVPEGAVAARMGGDEFTVILEYESEDAVDKMLNNIRTTLANVTKELGLPFPVELSMGVIITDPEDDRTLEEYVKQADYRMYEEKIRRKINRV